MMQDRLRGLRHRVTTVVVLTAMLAVSAAISVVGAAPASAHTFPGVYGSNSFAFAYCLDPGKADSEGQDYVQDAQSTAESQVYSWFAAHYGATGPVGPEPHNWGQAYDLSGPVLAGVDGVSAETATEGILNNMQLAAGSTPSGDQGDPNNTFATQLRNFASAFPGPWTLQVTIDPGPYAPGSTYNGNVVIRAANGAQVPVANIVIDIAAANNVSIILGNSSRTDANGFVPFTFTPGPGAFNVDLTSGDLATTAPVWNRVGGGNYQRMQTPATGRATTGFSGAAAPLQTQPVLSTQISTQRALVGDSIFDTIFLSGATAPAGQIDWALLGPVPGVVNPANGSVDCVGVVWAGAPIADSGSIAANDNGTYTTTPYIVATTGCYSYIESMPGNAGNFPAVGPPAGTVSETVIVYEFQPTVSTSISAQSSLVGDTITDDITVAGSGGYQGPVNWTLFGPVAPVPDAAGALTCVGVDWSGAPTAATGSVTADGDGTYTTDGYTITAMGCYTYSEYLVGDSVTAPAGPSTPGAVTETTLAVPSTPALSTQISDQTANVGDTVNDAITVTGSGNYNGPVDWTLLGPVTAVADAAGLPTCVGVDWTGAATAASGSVTVAGDGTYTTADYTVTVTGCYTYTEFLPGDETTQSAGPTAPGIVSETTLVTYHPTVSTQISKQRANVGDTITDAIKVTGSGGYQGLVKWTLYGPTTPKRTASGAPTCVGINWATAPVAATGSVTVNGDGTYTTAGYIVLVAGCYTYTESLAGDLTTTSPGVSTPGTPSETTLVVVPPPLTLGSGGNRGGLLALTGTNVATVALIGLLLILVGGGALVATRRRREIAAQ